MTMTAAEREFSDEINALSDSGKTDDEIIEWIDSQPEAKKEAIYTFYSEMINAIAATPPEKDK